jgi:hypothetical protein
LENKPEYTFEDVWELIRVIPPDANVYIKREGKVRNSLINMTVALKLARANNKTPRQVLNQYIQNKEDSRTKTHQTGYWIKHTQATSWAAYYGKIIYDTPLEQIPLYMNDPEVQDIVKWRLSIAK